MSESIGRCAAYRRSRTVVNDNHNGIFYYSWKLGTKYSAFYKYDMDILRFSIKCSIVMDRVNTEHTPCRISVFFPILRRAIIFHTATENYSQNPDFVFNYKTQYFRNNAHTDNKEHAWIRNNLAYNSRQLSWPKRRVPLVKLTWERNQEIYVTRRTNKTEPWQFYFIKHIFHVIAFAAMLFLVCFPCANFRYRQKLSCLRHYTRMPQSSDAIHGIEIPSKCHRCHRCDCEKCLYQPRAVCTSIQWCIWGICQVCFQFNCDGKHLYIWK